MPQYYVKMNYVIAYTTEFLIDGPDDEVIDDVLSSMGSDFLEENLKWTVSDYEEPVIEEIRPAEEKDMDFLEVSNKVYKKFAQIQKDIYEID
jgi:hypothetical protein